MASGELARRRRASRELKWVGAYSEARVQTLAGSQCEEELMLWGPDREGPSLTAPYGCRGPAPLCQRQGA